MRATRSNANSRASSRSVFAELIRFRRANGKGIGAMLKAVDQAYARRPAKLATPRLTRTLQAAVRNSIRRRAGTCAETRSHGRTITGVSSLHGYLSSAHVPARRRCAVAARRPAACG